MSKSTRNSTYPDPMALFESMMPNAGLDSTALKTVGEAGSDWAKGMAGVQEELASFVTTRLKHDAEYSQSLCSCKNWQQAAELQQDWIRNAVLEYGQATRTFGDLGTKMLTNYWRRVGAAAQTGSDPEK